MEVATYLLVVGAFLWLVAAVRSVLSRRQLRHQARDRRTHPVFYRFPEARR